MSTAMGVAAKAVIKQNHDTYTLAIETIKETVNLFKVTLERGRAETVALNRKAIDTAQGALNSYLELAKSLANAPTFAAVLGVQTAFVRRRIGVVGSQAEKMRALAAKLAADSAAPFKVHSVYSLETF